MGAVLSNLFHAGQVSPSSDAGWSPGGLWVSGSRTSSGETVSPITAFKLSAAYACIRVIAEDVAKLPFMVYERQQPSGRMERPEHPVSRLIGMTPNTYDTAVTFWGDIVADAASWHGGFALIVRNGRRIEAIERVDPALVARRMEDGDLLYDIYTRESGMRELEDTYPARDVIDIRGLGVGLNGWSLTKFAAESLGLGLAAQRHNAEYYGNGLNTNLAITHPGTLKAQALDNLRVSVTKHKAKHGSFSPLILEEDMKIQQLSAGLEDTQNVELRQFQVEEVCRYWRVNPNKVQHWLRTTFNNVAESNLDHVTDTLLPWLQRVEQECDRKLLGKEAPRLFTNHRQEALLWGKPIERAELMQTQFNTGAITINEMLDSMDRPQIGDEGNVRFINGNLVPLQQIAGGNPAFERKGEAQPVEGTDESTAATTGEPTENAVAFGTIADAQAQVIAAALETVLRKEQNAAERAVKKYTDAFDPPECMRQWWAEWSEKHGQHVRDAIAPGVEALGRMISVDVVPVLVEYAADHIAMSGAILHKAIDLGECPDLITDRPQRSAEVIVARIMEN